MAANEKVGIEIELMGGQEAYNLLKRIDNQIDTLNKKKKFKSLSGLNSSKKELESYIKELEELETKAEKTRKAMEAWGDPFKKSAAGQRLSAELEKSEKRAEEVRSQIKKMGSDMDSVTQKTRTFAQTFNSASSRIAHIGSAMQSLGNAMTRLTSPFRRLTTGLLMGAGYKALNMFTEGFGGAFERADIMKNYSRSLEAFGFSATDASSAIEELNESVLGLPTGLDEIVALQKKYLAASQDMEKATGLAIATNNSFLASGSDARQKKTAERIVSQLAGGAEIASTSWDALQRAMPLVFTTLAKESKMGVSEYMSALKSGKISTDEFIKSFTRIGKGGAIADAANVMKQSWAGLTANIQNATKRMGQGIIESLNSVFEQKTGRTLLQQLLGIDAEGKDLGDGVKHWVDGISESVQNWIKSHPEEIIEFFNDLKAIDWKGLLKGVGEGAMEIANLIRMFAKWASDKDMSKIGRMATRLNVLGWGLSTLGGVIKGLRHPLAGIYTLINFGTKGRLGKIGIFGKLSELFGKTKDIKTAGEAGSAITTASPKLVSAFKNMALLSGIVAMPAVTGFVVTGAVKQTVKNFKDIINLLKDMDWEAAAKVAAGIGAFIGGSAILGGVVGKFGVTAGTFAIIGETIVGLITSIASGFFAADMAMITSGIKNFTKSIKLLKDIPDVNSFGDVATKITNAVEMVNKVSALLNGEWQAPGVHEGGIQGVSLFTGMAIKNIANALVPLKKAVQNINELATMSIASNAADRISDIVDAITEISESLGKLWGFGFGTTKKNISNIADAIYELRRVVYHIGKIAGEKVSKKGLENIRDAIDQISTAFDTDAISDLRAKITTFVTAIKEAFAMLNELDSPLTIDATVKLSSDFDSSVKNVVKQMTEARRNIYRAWNGIPTELNKTITFTLNAKVVAENLYAGASRARSIAENALNSVRHDAKGGLIYRAKGGGVPWRRRGTDTVPAMLTPGEYVHNKRAVSTFGIDFMRKVNNLDVKGAMNELMHRAGNMANVNRGTTINNYNNNQKVVINNNGNPGAGFTFKSASRFVGAI